MPLKPGKSKQTIGQNIAELHKGTAFKKTAAKHGKETANKQAVAIAFSKAQESKGKKR